MTFSTGLRRAALLGSILGVTGCDVVDLVSNPGPKFEQTWSIPADTTKVSVASILPTGSFIYSTPGSNPLDSLGFLLTINNVSISRVLAPDCPACVPLNGTTAIKPAFILSAGNTSPLPQDMVSGAVLGGNLTVTVTNNLTFDPVRVRSSGTQGYMTLVVRSGSLVLGRDSINGATTPFPAGTQLIRQITLTTGVVTSGVSVDLTINSPVGDAPVPINTSRAVNVVAVVNQLITGTMRMNVVNKTLASISGASLPLGELDESITNGVVSGGFEMTITNPFAVTGSMNVQFSGVQQITKTVPLPTGANQVRNVSLTGQELDNLWGQDVGLSVGGTVSSTAPIDVTPKQTLIIANRLILTIRTGGAN